jgi:hypothetical protein
VLAGTEVEAENKMKDQMHRWSFLTMVGMSLGIGVIYEFAPFLAHRVESGAIADFFKANGDAPQASLSPSSAIGTSVLRGRRPAGHQSV